MILFALRRGLPRPARKLAAFSAPCLALLAGAFWGLHADRAVAATASAADCVAVNLAGDVSGFSSGCQVLGAANDKTAELNAEAAFDIDAWTFAGKRDASGGVDGDGGLDLGFALDDADGQGGSWSVASSLWDKWSSALILFMSASTKQAGTVGSAGNVGMFLVRPGVTWGEYASSLGKYDISHVSFYVAGAVGPGGLPASGASATAPAPTPLPADVWMLTAGLAGLGGLGAIGNRKGV